ncbi:MAG: hypothetical protein IPG80_12405 [Anaerolineales bacterium]|uniref:hypothetical protein n=1 Tax=Candidatus Villigracilis vicinus TaxID=3140679 RepID=UPI00313537B0|nr:hypothetical protein [Anaerolineales bacterium]
MALNEATELKDKITKKSNIRLPYMIILAVLGVLSVVSGVMNLYLMNAAANVISIDPLSVAIDITYGALLLFSSIMTFKGKVVAIWSFGGAVLVNVVGGLMLGRSVNFFVVLMGIVFLIQLFNLKKQGELS